MTPSTSTAAWKSFALAVVLAGAPAWAAGEITGRLTGFVYDPTASGLGEVPLTLRGSALMKPLTRTSGDDGHYEFPLLPPGNDYVLEVDVPGFAPIRKTRIVVELGRTTSVDVKLDVMTETTAATYEIVEKVNPIMAADSAQSTTVVTAEKASQTPVFHQVERMASQVAGVGPGTRPSTRGGLARYGKFYVDGMDTTDISDGSITAPMNFDVVDQFEIITGGFDAQYNALGAVTNVVTMSGSNKLKYDVNLTLSPSWMTAKNPVPGSQGSFVGTYLDNPSLTLADAYFYSPVAVLSGPIIKDKLWFSASGQLNFNRRQSLVSTPYSPQENRSTDTVTGLARLKLTWQATARDRVSLAFNYDHNTIDNVIGNGTVTLDADQRIDRGGFFLIANYDHSFSDNVLFQLQAGMTHKNVNQDPEKDTGLVSHFDSSQRVSQFSPGAIAADIPGNFLHESKQRIQFDPTLLVNIGHHQLKGGVQLSYQRGSQSTGVTQAQRFIDRGGVCDPGNPATFGFCSQHVDFYNQDGELAPQRGLGTVFTTGVFVQDRWTINRHLTVVPGLRVDVGNIYGNGTPIATLVGVGPRLSAVWDVLGDRQTIVTGHYGRSNDVGNVLVAQHANPALTQVTSTFSNGGFANCQPNVASPGCTQSGGSRTFGPGAAPSLDEIAFGVKHEILERTAVGVDFTWRRYSNMWADRETNRIYDPTGTRVVDYANGIPESRLQAAPSREAFREYKGVDLWVQGTPGNWDLLASYTLAFNTGTVDDYFSGILLNPRYTPYYYGAVSDDRRHTLKGSVSYKTPFGLDVGVRVQYLSGNPLWETFPNPNPSETQRVIRSPRGTGFPNDSSSGLPNLNDSSQWTELRNPSQLIIDLQVRYDVGHLFRLNEPRIELVGLLVNALNSTDATTLSDTFSNGATNRFGTALFRQAPLQAELILRVRN